MLRISKTFEDNETITLRLDGRLDQASAAELEENVREHRNGKSRAIILDFAGVVFVDDAGVELLRRVKDRRTRITNCSLFVKALISDFLEEGE
ncbi:MAG: STAS domain-containing protein [Candidatus Binatia bacterium]